MERLKEVVIQVLDKGEQVLVIQLEQGSAAIVLPKGLPVGDVAADLRRLADRLEFGAIRRLPRP